MPLEEIIEDDWLHIAIGSDNSFDLFNDVTDLRHNVLATSTCSNRTVLPFQFFFFFFFFFFFDARYALTSPYEA